MQKPNTQDFFKNIILKLSSFISPIIEKLNQANVITLEPRKIDEYAFVMSMLPSDFIIEEFIVNSFKHETKFWDLVYQKSDDDILKGLCNIFSKVVKYEDVCKIFEVKDKNGEFLISKEIKSEFYSILDKLILLAITFIHEKRAPYSVFNNKILEKKYEKIYMKDIDVFYYGKIFNAKLNFPIYDP